MSSESAVTKRIRVALARYLKREVSKVRLENDLRADLDLDSLAMIELIFKIEEEFDVQIPNRDLPKFTTVGDVAAYVEQRVKSLAPKVRTKVSTRPATKKGRSRRT